MAGEKGSDGAHIAALSGSIKCGDGTIMIRKADGGELGTRCSIPMACEKV
jgi:hypothetical protein